MLNNYDTEATPRRGEPDSTGREKERAILVGAGERYGRAMDEFVPDPLEELRLLADTAGAEVVGTLTQARSQIDPATYIGKGKVEELKALADAQDAGMVIFDNDLAPAQASNLEEQLQVRVLDRSGIILDIFALRAKTREAKTQVELAQLKYLLPRLTRRWTHLSRQAGGFIGMRGPGETQLEIDRRRIRERIAHLEEVQKTIEKQRGVSRKGRAGVFRAALVGYTNVGKSTLLNALSGSDAAVEDRLFKTLDSLTRAIRIPNGPELLLSDTVGFIRDLPHHLVTSFKSTLAEVRDADLLIHVIDITNPEWEEQAKVVTGVLHELEVSGTPVLTLFNKIDRLNNPAAEKAALSRYPSSLAISAATGAGLDAVRERFRIAALAGKVILTHVFHAGDPLLGEVYRHATIIRTEAEGEDIRLTFSLSGMAAKRLNLLQNEDDGQNMA